VKDIRAGYFGWVPLGDFPFKAGAEGFVKVTRGDRTLLEEPFCGYTLRFVATDAVKPDGEFDNVTGGEMPGAGLAVKIGPDEFVLIASRVSVEWRRADGKRLAVAAAEKGRFEKSRWVKTGPATPTVGQASCLPIPGLQAGRLHHYGQGRRREVRVPARELDV